LLDGAAVGLRSEDPEQRVDDTHFQKAHVRSALDSNTGVIPAVDVARASNLEPDDLHATRLNAQHRALATSVQDGTVLSDDAHRLSHRHVLTVHPRDDQRVVRLRRAQCCGDRLAGPDLELGGLAGCAEEQNHCHRRLARGPPTSAGQSHRHGKRETDGEQCRQSSQPQSDAWSGSDFELGYHVIAKQFGVHVA